MNTYCKDLILFLAQMIDGLKPKKSKNNEFVESRLENWV